MAERVIVEMTREQAQAVMKATELLARLELGQFKEISWHFLSKCLDENMTYDPNKRERIDELLEQACRLIFGINEYGWPDVREKSIMFERCWAVYTTIRYTLAWHDHPEGNPWSVSFDKPLGYGELMPKCEVKEGIA